MTNPHVPEHGETEARIERHRVMTKQREGLLELPDGTVCLVQQRKFGPYYKAPKPWGDDVWFVVPTDKRPSIVWED